MIPPNELKVFLVVMVFSLLAVACGTGDKESLPSTSPVPGSTLPRANVLGRDVRLIAYHNGEMAPEAVPEVAPREPNDLVVDDCRGLELFDTPQEVLDSEGLTIVLYWLEPGGKRDRSLTILGSTPSCRPLVEHELTVNRTG